MRTVNAPRVLRFRRMLSGTAGLDPLLTAATAPAAAAAAAGAVEVAPAAGL